MNCIVIPIQTYQSEEYQELLRSIEPENLYDLRDKLSAKGYEIPIHQPTGSIRNTPPINWELAKRSDLIPVYDYQTEKYLIVKDRYVGKCCWMNKSDFILLSQKGS
tara:strand:- start:57428 stop:57745 length:318 start_codon:yes stop_codon:yes gene_type:complete